MHARMRIAATCYTMSSGVARPAMPVHTIHTTPPRYNCHIRNVHGGSMPYLHTQHAVRVASSHIASVLRLACTLRTPKAAGGRLHISGQLACIARCKKLGVSPAPCRVSEAHPVSSRSEREFAERSPQYTAPGSHHMVHCTPYRNKSISIRALLLERAGGRGNAGHMPGMPRLRDCAELPITQDNDPAFVVRVLLPITLPKPAPVESVIKHTSTVGQWGV